MINDPCARCISADVCKYKEGFLAAKKDLDDAVSIYEEFMSVLISCKYCHSEAYRRTTKQFYVNTE